MGTRKNKKKKVEVEKLLLTRRILEVPCSNLGLDTRHPGKFSCIFYSVQANFLDHLGFVTNTCLFATY